MATTEITPGTSIDQTSGDGFQSPFPGTLIVDKNAHVISESAGNGADLADAWTVTVNGAIESFGSGYAGISLHSLSATSTITIGKAGDVFGDTAIETNEGGKIVNHGTIRGSDGIDYSGSGALSITNTGSLLTSGTALDSSGSGGVTLVNSGTLGRPPSGGLIIGPIPNAISIVGQAHITNSGTVMGTVSLGSGDDTFNDFSKSGSAIKNGSVTGTIDLGLGTNIFHGGSHAEKVIDDGGSDTVSLGGGNDTYTAAGTGSGGNGHIDGGTGVDVYDGSGGAAGVSINLDSVEHGGLAAHSASGADIGNDTILNFENVFSGENNSVVYGSAAANSLAGEAGADQLYGLGGNDVLSGGGSSDTLVGGAGADTLTGGSGADSFVFTSIHDSGTSATSRDVITDFTQGTDKIDLHDIDANSTTHLVNDSFTLTGNHGLDAFTHQAGQLRYSYSGGNTIVSGDVNGDGKADFSIELQGHILLQASDFIL